MQIIALLAVDYNSKDQCHSSLEFVDTNILVNFTLKLKTSYYNYYNRQFTFNLYTHDIIRAGMPLNTALQKFHFCIQV